MVSVPKRVKDRFAKQVPIFQKVLQSAKDRDVNESDTVMIITDMLASIFGYDKYTDITSEQAIRGTYCDLAIQMNAEIKFLIEVKAIGLTLKENHLRQAVNYGANHGVQWVVLTNGIVWDIYRLRFERPVTYDITCSFNVLDLNLRKSDDQDKLFLLCKEGLSKDAIKEFHEHVRVVNRFVVAALVQTDPLLDTMRRELRRMSPGIKVEKEEIRELLFDVIKRDVIEGDSADRASSWVKRAASKPIRKRRSKSPSLSASTDALSSESKSDENNP